MSTLHYSIRQAVWRCLVNVKSGILNKHHKTLSKLQVAQMSVAQCNHYISVSYRYWFKYSEMHTIHNLFKHSKETNVTLLQKVLFPQTQMHVSNLQLETFYRKTLQPVSKMRQKWSGFVLGQKNGFHFSSSVIFLSKLQPNH